MEAAGAALSTAADASPDSRRSQLSLDDLADGGASPGPAESSSLDDTKRIEAKLQLNLQQQKEHYARQRELFEALGRDSVLGLSPSAFSVSGRSDDDGDNDDGGLKRRLAREPRESPSPDDGLDVDASDSVAIGRTKNKFKLHFQSDLVGTTGKKHQTTVDKRAVRRVSESDRDEDLEDDDSITAMEIERLQRKAKRIANYHSRIATGSTGLHFTRGTTTSKASASVPRARHGSIHRLDESTAHYDSSNEALRKQLELLRRLQLENNRFRHENRSLREQNDVLEEQSALHSREIKRLTDEVSDLSLRVQHDQLELATAAQNARKMKQLQKQLDALQAERDQLQTSLQEAADQDAQLRLHTQNEIESIVQESKHLKRSLKQSRQHETRLQEQLEEIKSALTAAEQYGSELKRQLLEAKRENSEMATRLSEKASRVEAIESSASQCVERMEAGMEALQKAHNGEREKRKKLEKQRDTLQTEMSSLELAHSKLEERVHELESYNTQLQQRLQDTKLEKKQDKKFQEDRVHEFQERQKSDAKTIATLRDECAAYEQQLEAARASVVEIRKEVALECNALRKDVEALRNYVEDAQRAPLTSSVMESGPDDGASTEVSRAGDRAHPAPPLPPRARRDELWVQLPELQFLLGALGGLRNEAMNFVGDFQRLRHQLRQLGAKLTAAQERTVELEHTASEHALARKELADQRVLAEQAREIALREKMEVLTWSQQACEKSERLEAALAACAGGMQGVVKKARRTATAIGTALVAHGRRDDDDDSADHTTPVPPALVASKADEDAEAFATRLLGLLERDVQELVARAETLTDAYKVSTNESEDRARQLARLEKELDAQRQDHTAVVAEIEALHTRSAAEQQALFRSTLRAVEGERDALQKDLADEREALAAMQGLNETLEQKLRGLEQDAPVLLTVVQLFALVVPPMLRQVNDLLAQKRVLTRENVEYAAAHEQVECIAQVLRELVPAGGSAGLDGAEQRRRQRRRQFRRVVIAVFALNRFQRGGFVGSVTGTGESVYGISTSLKPAKKRGKVALSSSSSSGSALSSCLPPQTKIKVLAPKPLLARLDLRALLDRLHAMDLTAKLRDAVNSDGDAPSSSSFGSLLVSVLSAVDPDHKEALDDDTSGVFHCRALLERRKAARWHDGTSGAGDHDTDARLSTVDLVRKRILALGKRLEDLHYQRNALQNENYDFQYQLDQQAAQLQEMDALAAKNEELQREIEQLHDKSESDATAKQAELVEKERVLEQRQRSLETQRDQIAQLEHEVATLETRLSEVELEKTDLHHALLVAKSASAAEEEKLHKSRVGLDRQAEELRALKQAAKRAHELHERVAWQLEQELVEKATLQATMEHLRKQKETLERQVARANVRALDESTDIDETPDEDPKGVAQQTKAKTAGGSSLAVSTSFASSDSSYDRELQDLSDRIANMRNAAASAGRDDDDDGDVRNLDEGEHAARGTEPRIVPARRTVDAFRSEWQRLDISGVFDEAQPRKSDIETTHSGARLPARAEPVGHDQIDKVNSAVHDYMDRIDEKLQQMYGIPKSASRQRPPPSASVIHGSKPSAKKATEVRWGDATELE